MGEIFQLKSTVYNVTYPGKGQSWPLCSSMKQKFLASQQFSYGLTPFSVVRLKVQNTKKLGLFYIYNMLRLLSEF